MALSLPLRRGRITLSDALRKDDNYLKLTFPEIRLNFYLHLYQSRSVVEALVAHHLRLPRRSCEVGDAKEWIHGNFNVLHTNIPAELPCGASDYQISHIRWGNRIVRATQKRSFDMRWLRTFGLEEHVLRFQFPGFEDLDFRMVMLYVNRVQFYSPFHWLHLILFYLEKFTAVENAPFFSRLQWYFRKIWPLLFGSPIPAPYIGHKTCHVLEHGYMIIEYVEDGEMLSVSWETHRRDHARRANLFRDSSQLMLSLARIPLFLDNRQ